MDLSELMSQTFILSDSEAQHIDDIASKLTSLNSLAVSGIDARPVMVVICQELLLPVAFALLTGREKLRPKSNAVGGPI